MKTIIINLFGGPGTGKSTLMAQLYAKLKILGYETEMAPEFAKEKVWEESYKTLEDQIYVFAKQLHKINRLIGKVDIIICDSPLPFSLIYDKTKNEKFASLVMDQFNSFTNLNFFITRSTSYITKGRLQTEEESKQIDEEILKVLETWQIPYETVGKDESLYLIMSEILKNYEDL